MLDFLYDNENPLKIQTECAVQLYYLGEYLDIRQLRWDVMQFCKKDISLENVDEYYNHAMVFHSDAILGVIAKFLGENILNVTTSSDILLLSNPRLWINAFEFSPKTSEASIHISKLVATLVKCRPDSLDIETLHDLTRGEFLPKLDPDAALIMCALEDTLEDNKSSPQTEPSHLQERCVDSLSRIWQSLAEPDTTTLELLLERKPSFLVDLLLKSWKDATETIEETKKKLSAAQVELRKFKPIDQDSFSRYVPCGNTPIPAALVKQNPCLNPSATTILLHLRNVQPAFGSSPFGSSSGGFSSSFGESAPAASLYASCQPSLSSSASPPQGPCPIFIYQP